MYKPFASITIHLFLNLSMVAVLQYLHSHYYTNKLAYKFRRGPPKLGGAVSVFVPSDKVFLGGPVAVVSTSSTERENILFWKTNKCRRGCFVFVLFEFALYRSFHRINPGSRARYEASLQKFFLMMQQLPCFSFALNYRTIPVFALW